MSNFDKNCYFIDYPTDVSTVVLLKVVHRTILFNAIVHTRHSIYFRRDFKISYNVRNKISKRTPFTNWIVKLLIFSMYQQKSKKSQYSNRKSFVTKKFYNVNGTPFDRFRASITNGKWFFFLKKNALNDFSSNG